MKGKWALFFVCSLCWGAVADELVLNTSNSETDKAVAFNETLAGLKLELRRKFDEVKEISNLETKEDKYQQMLVSVRALREKIRNLEEKWRESSADASDEAYALWDVGDITLSQLIMEYGASDYLYVIPPELSGMKMSLFSNIPLPHESWSEMIEMILAHNGVGAKRLNPFVKQLYILKLDPSAIEGIVAAERDLPLFAAHARLFYVFSPPPEQLKAIQAFFERFSDPKQTFVQAIGSKISIVSSRETVEKLLGLYHAVWEQNQGKVVRLVNVAKMNVQEAEKILKTVFIEGGNKGRPTYYPSNVDELSTFILPQGLVLIGENGIVERAEKILADLECQLEDPGEKVIYWYTCKHSKPEDIAEVLDKVYDSLIGCAFEKKIEAPSLPHPIPPSPPSPVPPATAEPPAPGPFPYIAPGAPFNPVLPATSPFIQPALIDKDQRSAFGNFIVDTKTSAILMVIRREELSKIKALLKRLDVPKRMVQLDVLLVEKKLNDRKEVGFNILQFGTNSSGKKENALTYNAFDKEKADDFKNGLLSYIFSRPSGRFPAVDLKFNFLLTQQDIRINANPSVLAINQTPAMIAIQEEISINNGAFPINTPTGVVVENSYTRAQYGITINLTPTIHMPDSDDDGPGFISLETNLEFDTSRMLTESKNDRPPVTRRKIENEVRVADGETIILGGLRQRIQEDMRDKIPFLGDLPGIGKLFGTARSSDINTEMFIFITPRIIRDPIDDLRCIRQEEYRKRAGDIPEFLKCLDDAREQEKRRLFKDSLKTLFDLYNY